MQYINYISPSVCHSKYFSTSKVLSHKSFYRHQLKEFFYVFDISLCMSLLPSNTIQLYISAVFTVVPYA
jgi:hypothetical protein